MRPPIFPFRPLAALLLGVLVLAGCTETSPGGSGASAEALPTGLVGPVAPTVGPDALRYVALGDSYTFGDGVQLADRWPNQLTRILRPDLDMELVANLSDLSSLSRDLIQDQLPRLIQLDPQFVSVQVGINDIVVGGGTSSANFSANMAEILDTVLGQGVPADRIIVLTIPDYTLTPAGPSRFGEPEARSARIREFNGLLQAAAAARAIAVVDISPISDRVSGDPSLVASDGLHPSGKQYAGWADLVAERVRQLFRAPEDRGGASPSALADGDPAAGGERRDAPTRVPMGAPDASMGAPDASMGAPDASMSP